MSITSYTSQRIGNVVTVTVQSDIVPDFGEVIYFHWYLDGAYAGMTTDGSQTFYLEDSEQVQIVAQDTVDSDYDVMANAPAQVSARRSLWFVRSASADVERYQIEQKKDAGDYAILGYVLDRPGQWSYAYMTPRLTDLSVYQWRITPIDRAGNEGTPIVIGPETIVRRPDVQDYAISWDDGTQRVTFASA